jgi:hypothetical protein
VASHSPHGYIPVHRRNAEWHPLTSNGSFADGTLYAIDQWDPAKPPAVGAENADVWGELYGAGPYLYNRYLFGPGRDDPVTWQQGATTRWYGTDRLGSVRMQLTYGGSVETTTDYDAFGMWSNWVRRRAPGPCGRTGPRRGPRGCRLDQPDSAIAGARPGGEVQVVTRQHGLPSSGAVRPVAGLSSHRPSGFPMPGTGARSGASDARRSRCPMGPHRSQVGTSKGHTAASTQPSRPNGSRINGLIRDEIIAFLDCRGTGVPRNCSNDSQNYL